jgi:hypothetical protein
MVTGSAPSAQTLLLTMVPTLWAGMLRGQPANICVDSCRILQCCYAQFGIRSEIRAVDLAVTDDAGRTYMHGTPQPSWEGNVLDGHCILYLPDEQRVVDATIEQFREIARLKHGPLVGRMAVQLTPGLRGSGGRLPAGAQLPIRRANLTLLYDRRRRRHPGHPRSPGGARGPRRTPASARQPGLGETGVPTTTLAGQAARPVALPAGRSPACRRP